MKYLGFHAFLPLAPKISTCSVEFSPWSSYLAAVGMHMWAYLGLGESRKSTGVILGEGGRLSARKRTLGEMPERIPKRGPGKERSENVKIYGGAGRLGCLTASQVPCLALPDYHTIGPTSLFSVLLCLVPWKHWSLKTPRAPGFLSSICLNGYRTCHVCVPALHTCSLFGIISNIQLT